MEPVGRVMLHALVKQLKAAGLITLNEKFEPGLNGVKAEVLEKFLVDLLKRQEFDVKLDEEKKRFIEAIGNPSRLKILLVLWKSDKELTVYKIYQRTGLGRTAASRHLFSLVDAGLVSRRIYGEIPLYAINGNDPRARAIVEFFTKIRL